jgi:hypothetical protein
MMEKDKERNADEIDLTQFFKWIKSGFANIGQGLLISLARLRNVLLTNWLFFFILIATGVGLSIMYSGFFEKKYYASSMIIKCEYLNMRIIQNSIDKLNLLCGEKDRKGLAELLKIDQATAKNIYRFSAKNFVSENDRIEIEVLKEQLNNLAADRKELVNKVIGKIEIGNHQSFQINVQVHDPEIVRPLELAIVNLFKENEYVKKRIEANTQNLLGRRAKLIAESKKLDSLKEVLFVNYQTMANQRREGSNNVILSDKYLTDPISVFKEDLNLNNELRAIDELLYIKPSFEVVDGLTTFREPDNFSLPKVIVISFFGSILAGYILLGLWRFNKYLAKLEPSA